MKKSKKEKQVFVHAAIFAGLTLISSSAFAIKFGDMVVYSPLGEKLNAQVAISQISPSESASLKVRLANRKAYEAAGLEYNPAFANFSVLFKKRGNGEEYIEINSSQSLNEPFLDLLLEADSAGGTVARSYTFFLTPVIDKKEEAASLDKSPGVSRQDQGEKMLAMPLGSSDRPAAQINQKDLKKPQHEDALESTGPKKKNQKKRAVAAGEEGRRSQHLVKAGETAGKIAVQNKPKGVSLDQMLVAMLELNPKAFSNQDVNRMKAGLVIEIPATEDALKVSKSEAARMVIAQGKEFAAYKRLLAGRGVRDVSQGDARSSQGNIEVAVSDKAGTERAESKLTLSKSASGMGSGQMKQIAHDKAEQDRKAHTQELESNIEAIKKAQNEVAALSQTQEKTQGIATVRGGAGPIAEPSKQLSPSGISAIKPEAKNDGILEMVLSNPLIAGSIGVLIVLVLLGINFLRKKKRKEDEHFLATSFDSTPMEVEPTVHPVDEGPAMGGDAVKQQEVKSSDGKAAAMAKVDLVAESAVYLSYGKVDQAIEILKDAIKKQPNYALAYLKLLEIYVMQGDVKKFHFVAEKARLLIDESSLEWGVLADLYQQMAKIEAWQQAQKEDNAATPLAPGYAFSAAPSVFQADEPKTNERNPFESFSQDTQRLPIMELEESSPFDFDFSSNTPIPAELSEHKSNAVDLDVDFSNTTMKNKEFDDDVMKFDFNSFLQPSVLQTAATVPSLVEEKNVTFDDSEAGGSTLAHGSGLVEDSDEVKLMLAQEFFLLGDIEGAKSLANEVLSRTKNDALKKKAELALARMK